MGFQKLTEHDKINLPVKREQKEDMKYFYCDSFTGELSSKTGIYSKFMFIGRIVSSLNPTIEPELLPPTVTILCGPECREHCINLSKIK